MTTEFVYGVKNYLDQLYYNPNNITNLEALMKFTQSDPREDYPNTNVDAWKKALSANTSLDSVEYRTALAEDAWIGTSGTLIGTMEKYSLDAIIVPAEVAPNIAALASESLQLQYIYCISFRHGITLMIVSVRNRPSSCYCTTRFLPSRHPNHL